MQKNGSSATVVRAADGLRGQAHYRLEHFPQAVLGSPAFGYLGPLRVEEQRDRVISSRSSSDQSSIGRVFQLERHSKSGRGGSRAHCGNRRVTTLASVTLKHTQMTKPSAQGVVREYLDVQFALASVNTNAGIHAPKVSAADRATVERFLLMELWRMSKAGLEISDEMKEFCAAAVAAARREDLARRL